MSTNFYIRGHRSDDSPEWHIGKRSAAGLYCHDCKQTLCPGGESRIHYSDSEWPDACPKCGKKRDHNGGGAVRGCCSFSWAMTRERLNEVASAGVNCPCCDRPFPDGAKVIEDEYGHLFTLEEFEDELRACAVHFSDSIGAAFS